MLAARALRGCRPAPGHQRVRQAWRLWALSDRRAPPCVLLVSYMRCAPALTVAGAGCSYSGFMPADTPHPDRDWPAPAGLGADVPHGDEPLMGYECAMPWLYLAAPAPEPTRPAWQGGLTG